MLSRSFVNCLNRSLVNRSLVNKSSCLYGVNSFRSYATNESADIDFVSNFKSTSEIFGRPFPTADSNRPATIEDLVIEYVDPYKRDLQEETYFRFVEPRDGYTVEKFLKKIGRGCDAFVEHFPTWEDLMNANSNKMKHVNQIPSQNRKWILHWVEQWKQGRNPVLISKSKSVAKKNLKKGA